MDRRERIKNLLSLPTYRSRLIFFVVLGVTIVLLALLTRNANAFLSDLLVEFAVVFIAIGVVTFVWDFLGGDPMELRISDSFAQVDTKLDTIQRSMGVLSDIVDKNLGIERIWPTRRIWENDPLDGLAAWKKHVCEAESIDIVSNTLWTRWFHDDVFRKRFFTSLEHDLSARILLYDPNADILSIRAKDERDTKIGKTTQMQIEIYSTLEKIAMAREELSEVAKKNLQVKLTTDYYHLAQIIRADEQMVVAIYLSGKTGSPSPTLQFRGPNTTYYLTYLDQIKILWERGREVEDTEFRQILGQTRMD